MTDSKAYPPKESFEVDDISLDEDDVAVIVPAYDVTAIDDTADLEDQQIHDQLPSVEEAKANLPHQPVSAGKRLKMWPHR